MLLPLLLLAAAAAPTGDLEGSIKKLTDVLSIARSEAADPVNGEAAMYQGAIPGMLRRLDPHSVFFDPGQYQQLQQMEKSERKGFGTVVSVLPGRVFVLQALPGTPSGRAGLAPGDEIVAINNIALSRLDFEQLVGFLQESRQRTARLDVRRPDNVRILQFVLNPELLDTPSVDRAFLIEPDIGYIRVASFEPLTTRQLKQAIEKLGGDKLGGLIVDLRDNPGGVVQAAVEIAGFFLKPGQRVLSVKGRAVKDEEIDVPKTANPYHFPMAVLMNGKSASCSEIVAGALQDHDRAAIVGEPSFGKGLVQSIFPLSSTTAVALTTSFYYTPSGRSIQKPLSSGQLDFAKPREKFKTDSGRTVLGGGGIQPDIEAHMAEPTQLRVALEASGTITAFASAQKGKIEVTEAFQVTPAMLDEFEGFASQRRIQPSVSEWLRERDWIQSRLKQEIVTQTLGVEKGDEVEMKRDEQARAALTAIKKQRAASVNESPVSTAAAATPR